MFRDLIQPHRWWPPFLIALAGKLLLLAWMLAEHGVSLSGPWYSVGGDAMGYIGPMESVLEDKGYVPDHRLPGYGAPYLILRLLMDRPAITSPTISVTTSFSRICPILDLLFVKGAEFGEPGCRAPHGRCFDGMT